MKPPTERLLDVAKRLDELAEDGPSELTSLSDELGEIVEALDQARARDMAPGPQHQHRPDWERQLLRVVEQAALEIVAERYGTRGDMHTPYVDVRLPNPNRVNNDLQSRMYAQMQPVMNPSDVIKGLGVI